MLVLSLLALVLCVEDAGTPSEAKWLHAAAELSATSFPSGTPGGAQDGFFDVLPLAGVDFEHVSLELGAQLRLRVVDNPPSQRAGDLGGVLRGADWDELSDFGQLLRALRLGQPETLFWVLAGPARRKTLGLGHLLARYSNQDNPDYHPAAATVGASYKAVRGELFVSDVLGARLFAGEAVVDFGRIFGSTASSADRFHLAVSGAHDAGRAGGLAPPVSLLHIDLDAVLYRGATTRIMAVVGAGARLPDAAATAIGFGLVAGVSLDAMLPSGFSIGGRVELRKQGPGFRHAFFGAGYELGRFAATGFSGPGLAAERLPDALSFAADVRIASGRAVSFDVALEHFIWGRTDLDVLFSLEIIDQRLTAGARFTGTGLGKLPRYAMTTELRLRLFTSLYALGSGGTVFVPQPDSTLVRGVFVSLGVGFDLER